MKAIRKSAKQTTAEKSGFIYVDIPITCGPGPKQWLCARTDKYVEVERAVLSHFGHQGWRGFSGEGGLLLNLIKAMSFNDLPTRLRCAYVEAIYAQNVAFEQDRYAPEDLLDQIPRATRAQVERNFDLMISRGPFVEQYEGFTSTSTTSILDFFPGLERWMLVELMAVAGHELIQRIASKFAHDPYEYRRGWPDITMWRDGELRFVEVKAPGDTLGKSQKKIAAEFAAPFELNFYLASVNAA